MTDKLTSHLSTDCAHAGEHATTSSSSTVPSAQPIFQTSVYDFPNLDVVDEVWEGRQQGFIYGRFGSPNTVALEGILSRLERGEAALASASGMASLMVAFTTILQTGDEVLVASDSYGGTIGLAARELPRFGVTARFVTDTRPASVAAAITPKTRAFLAETISNPLWNVIDVPALAEVCRSHDTKFVVDNTSATPCLIRPLEMGADVVVHSTTKFMGGHHDVTGGVMVANRDFIAKARDSAIRLGPSLSSFDAWLTVRGIKTLALRMERICSNALAIARFLEANSRIRHVYYPGLESHAHNEVVRRTMKGNGGGMMSFDMKGDLASADAFVRNLKMIRFAPSFGGVTTTITHPAKTSHRSLTAAQRAELRITDTLIRVSIGIEDPEDIIEDLKNALG